MNSSKRILILTGAFVLFALLFLVVNRGAYRGYFANDDLDSIATFKQLVASDVVNGLVSPALSENNFRPIGHGIYIWLSRTAELNFPPYVAAIHILHFATVIVVFLLLRAFQFEDIGAMAGALFFGFNMGLIEAFWKPMYVFDVTCGLFCALSLLAWVRGRWILSLIAFWLAFKSKELAVMLPFALVVYEYWLGERRWKRLIPFLAISGIMIFQAGDVNAVNDPSYQFQLHPGALFTTLGFYSTKIFLIPYLGLALIIAGFLIQNRKARFGLATAGLLLLPMLFLPERLYAAYLYAPMIGVAIFIGSLFRNWKTLAIFAALWIPWNFYQSLVLRKPIIEEGNSNRQMTAAVLDAYRDKTPPDVCVIEGDDQSVHRIGLRGLCLYVNPKAEVIDFTDKRANELLARPSVAYLHWVEPWKKLQVVRRDPSVPDQSYVTLDVNTPVWQLASGWYPVEWAYRWTMPHATARLERPANAQKFEMRILVGPGLIERVKQTRLRVSLNGEPIGDKTFDNHGWYTVSFDLKPGAPGQALASFDIDPPFFPNNDGTHPMGLAIGSFGFK